LALALRELHAFSDISNVMGVGNKILNNRNQFKYSGLLLISLLLNTPENINCIYFTMDRYTLPYCRNYLKVRLKASILKGLLKKAIGGSAYAINLRDYTIKAQSG